MANKPDAVDLTSLLWDSRHWTLQEDDVLLRHAVEHGTKHWGELHASGKLPRRDNKACCNRFLFLKKRYTEERPYLQAGVGTQGCPVVVSSRQGPITLGALTLEECDNLFFSGESDKAAEAAAAAALAASMGLPAEGALSSETTKDQILASLMLHEMLGSHSHSNSQSHTQSLSSQPQGDPGAHRGGAGAGAGSHRAAWGRAHPEDPAPTLLTSASTSAILSSGSSGAMSSAVSPTEAPGTGRPAEAARRWGPGRSPLAADRGGGGGEREGRAPKGEVSQEGLRGPPAAAWDPSGAPWEQGAGDAGCARMVHPEEPLPAAGAPWGTPVGVPQNAPQGARVAGAASTSRGGLTQAQGTVRGGASAQELSTAQGRVSIEGGAATLRAARGSAVAQMEGPWDGAGAGAEGEDPWNADPGALSAEAVQRGKDQALELSRSLRERALSLMNWDSWLQPTVHQTLAPLPTPPTTTAPSPALAAGAPLAGAPSLPGGGRTAGTPSACPPPAAGGSGIPALVSPRRDREGGAPGGDLAPGGGVPPSWVQHERGFRKLYGSFPGPLGAPRPPVAGHPAGGLGLGGGALPHLPLGQAGELERELAREGAMGKRRMIPLEVAPKRARQGTVHGVGVEVEGAERHTSGAAQAALAAFLGAPAAPSLSQEAQPFPPLEAQRLVASRSGVPAAAADKAVLWRSRSPASSAQDVSFLSGPRSRGSSGEHPQGSGDDSGEPSARPGWALAHGLTSPSAPPRRVVSAAQAGVQGLGEGRNLGGAPPSQPSDRAQMLGARGGLASLDLPASWRHPPTRSPSHGHGRLVAHHGTTPGATSGVPRGAHHGPTPGMPSQGAILEGLRALAHLGATQGARPRGRQWQGQGSGQESWQKQQQQQEHHDQHRHQQEQQGGVPNLGLKRGPGGHGVPRGGQQGTLSEGALSLAGGGGHARRAPCAPAGSHPNPYPHPSSHRNSHPHSHPHPHSHSHSHSHSHPHPHPGAPSFTEFMEHAVSLSDQLDRQLEDEGVVLNSAAKGGPLHRGGPFRPPSGPPLRPSADGRLPPPAARGAGRGGNGEERC